MIFIKTGLIHLRQVARLEYVRMHVFLDRSHHHLLVDANKARLLANAFTFSRHPNSSGDQQTTNQIDGRIARPNLLLRAHLIVDAPQLFTNQIATPLRGNHGLLFQRIALLLEGLHTLLLLAFAFLLVGFRLNHTLFLSSEFLFFNKIYFFIYFLKKLILSGFRLVSPILPTPDIFLGSL